MAKTQIKRYDISITAANSTVSEEFELDKTVCAVLGLALTSDRDDLMFYRGSQKIELNACELLPENYESKLLMTGINVSPNTRFYDTGRREVKNGKIKIIYTDVDHPNADFEAYRVSLYVKSEESEE